MDGARLYELLLVDVQRGLDVAQREAFYVDEEEAQVAEEEALLAPAKAGYCWQPLYDRLEETGHDARLAHPLKVKAIAQAKAKTDKIDSETLAHMLRADLIPESYVPPRDIRELRDRVRLHGLTADKRMPPG